MPACDDGPRWKVGDVHEPHAEWADRHGTDDRQHTDVGVGSAQYFTWAKYLQAYIQRQPPGAGGYYPDSEIVIFIDNGNSYCFSHGAESVKKNVEALKNIMTMLKHWKMSLCYGRCEFSERGTLE